MMTKQFILFLFLTIYTVGRAQNSLEFSSLDTVFRNARIIGAGESTHGTSEYTIVRHELFKYLVENHGFNTFFLEADYSACQRVNRYIQGADDDVYLAIDEIQLFPWLTEEMISLIRWCKSYNEKYPNTIKFVGCDMQFIQDDYQEFKRLTELSTKEQLILGSIFVDLEYTSGISLIQERNIKWEIFKKSALADNLSLNKNLNFHLMSRTIDQWFGGKLNSGIEYNYRDSSMASNIADYLAQNPNAKGFYFAHNWHVANILFTYKKEPSFRTAGAFLKEQFGDRYHIFGLISSDLQFNAKTCENNKAIMERFTLHANKRLDIEQEIAKKTTSETAIISANTFRNIKKYAMIDIGALFGKRCDGSKVYPRRQLSKGQFDSFIYIKSSSPSHLISW